MTRDQDPSATRSRRTSLIHGDDGFLAERAMSPSVDMSVTFRPPDGPTDPAVRKFYSRYGNPTVDRVAELVALLEGGEEAIMTSSGMAAINVVLFSLLESGMEVVVHREIYSETSELLDEYARFGIVTTKLDSMTPEAVRRAVTANTGIVWLESPTNPLLTIIDIAAIADVCHEVGAICVIDNTVASSSNQRPLELGVDIVVTSSTKSTSGHSDIVAGAVVTSAALADRIRWPQIVQGALLQPFEAWLLLRSIRTLDIRVDVQNATALRIAEELEAHPAVEFVLYPGLPSSPGHEIAKKQMYGFGSLLSFVVRGGFDAAANVLARFELIAQAPSIGAVHTMAVHPAASWMGHSYRPAEADYLPVGLLRLSVGLEDPLDLVADLSRCLDQVVER